MSIRDDGPWPVERRRANFEGTLLALRGAREQHDVLAIAAHGLGRTFDRPCVAYELRESSFRPVAAIGVYGERAPIVIGEADLRALLGGVVVQSGTVDYVAVLSDGSIRGLLALERATAPFDDQDLSRVRNFAAHVSLALDAARSFDQLRRHAAEGAALTEAARTLLAFTEREALSVSLCRIAIRLVRATCAGVYAPREDALVRVAYAAVEGSADMPATLSPDLHRARAELAVRLGHARMVLSALPMPSAAVPDARPGLLVLSRGERFEKGELRLIDALVTLAALAIRNVDLYEQTGRANGALAESNAFKDDLMAMFAHDFRGPLTVISGHSELLLGSGDPAVRRSAQTIAEQTQRLGKLSEDALALAATQSAGFSLSRERSDLTAFVRATVASLDRAGDRVVVSAPAGPVPASFDRARLRHVVDNVVGNALKYSEGPVNITLAAGDGAARIDVADRGIGIPAADLERIFLRFGRATNARSRGIPGTGVGLYIARKIVEVHGGRLSVTSREGEGSTFSIVLPLLE